jgi:HlyD family secretion protein
MNKKLLWIIIGVVVIAGVLFGLKAAHVIGKEEGIKVSTEKAAKRTITETVTASGKVYPEVEVKVSSDVSGEIVQLNVEESDTVRKGEVIAKIYPDIYLSQKDQAAAGVSQYQAQVANAAAQAASTKAILDQTSEQYNRQKQLLADKVISKMEFEQSEQAYKSALANYNASQQSIKAAQAAEKSAMANLNSAAKNVDKTVLVAPMDGVVSLLSVKKGERVAGNQFSLGTEIMRIADMNSIVAQVDVGENDIPKVKIGDTAVIEIDAYNNRKFKGIVFKIANPTTSATTSSSTDVTNYKVHIRLLVDGYRDLIKKGSFPFRPGMSASADIQTRTERDVLSVPLNAVTTRDKDADKKGDTKKKDDSKNQSNPTDQTPPVGTEPEEVVFILQKDNTVKKVKVKTGIQDLNSIQIMEGLKEGDEVITGPYATVSKTLQNGTKVLVTPKDKLYDDKKK